jgi:hypothetical protein
MRLAGDSRRRFFGAMFLALAVVLLIAGQTFLKDRLKSDPAWFVSFWSACFLFTGLTIAIALLDLRAVRRRSTQEQKDLYRKTWADIAPEDGDTAREKRGTRPDYD